MAGVTVGEAAACVGEVVGMPVFGGAIVGPALGFAVEGAAADGAAVGALVGAWAVGDADGADVGDAVGPVSGTCWPHDACSTQHGGGWPSVQDTCA